MKTIGDLLKIEIKDMNFFSRFSLQFRYYRNIAKILVDSFFEKNNSF